MSQVRQEQVSAADDGLRLDRWFKQHLPDLPFGRLQKLLRTGQIRVDGKRVKTDARLAEGAIVRIPPIQLSDTPPPQKKKAPRPEDVKFLKEAILYQDDLMIAINKPPGLAVQGGSKTTRHLDGMLDALKFKSEERPRLVHRLDKDTSGVLVLARTRKAAQFLTKAFANKSIRKVYWALVIGNPEHDEGEITSRMAKQGGQGSERMETADDGLRAVTDYVRIDHAGTKAAWLALMPRTGRTHQLRVHCATMGTPIVGDGKYGGADSFIDGLSKSMHLHARELRVPHPTKGEVKITAPLPQHMQESWQLFEFDEREALDVFEDE
jgi:23S rRNA pseudouridine955/2504/2580 synthase